MSTIESSEKSKDYLSGCNIKRKFLRCQSVLNTKADEVENLKKFCKRVNELTGGTITIRIFPARAIVGVKETLYAVDKGIIDCGFAWTHYWSGDHPAAMLFGGPVAGAGGYLDNLGFLSWFNHGDGKKLYDNLWNQMGRNVKGFMLQPVGPEALGWFPKPINSMRDFRELKIRTPPGIPGQTYKDIGIRSVAMGGGDILPALESGRIDAAEWCCPKPDKVLGLQKVLKHYYLQGLHQVVVNADFYINKTTYNRFSDHEKLCLEIAANECLMNSQLNRIHEQGNALNDLINNDNVKIHDTPKEYFKLYAKAADNILEQNANENLFFQVVHNSQIQFSKKHMKSRHENLKSQIDMQKNIYKKN